MEASTRERPRLWRFTFFLSGLLYCSKSNKNEFLSSKEAKSQEKEEKSENETERTKEGQRLALGMPSWAPKQERKRQKDAN